MNTINFDDTEKIERLNSRVAELLAEVAALKRHAQGRQELPMTPTNLRQSMLDAAKAPAQGAPHTKVMEVINERLLAYYEELESRNDLTDLGKHAKNAIQNLKRDVEYALSSSNAPAAQRAPEPLSLQAAREDERLACWKIAEEERRTAEVDKQAWLVAFDIANAIKMRGTTLTSKESVA